MLWADHKEMAAYALEQTSLGFQNDALVVRHSKDDFVARMFMLAAHERAKELLIRFAGVDADISARLMALIDTLKAAEDFYAAREAS